MRTPESRSQEAMERLNGALSSLEVIAHVDEGASGAVRSAILEVQRSISDALELAWPNGMAEATDIMLASRREQSPPANAVAHKVVRRKVKKGSAR